MSAFGRKQILKFSRLILFNAATVSYYLEQPGVNPNGHAQEILGLVRQL